ncbi:MAG: MNIO family bufferin maturase [Chromatiales bacterium]
MTLRRHCACNADPIPAQAGIGLRAEHYREVLESRPRVGWLEVHSENYFGEGGAPLHYLEQIRSHYPLSLHGVGLSLGSTDPLNTWHLEKLKRLIQRFEPTLVSEHLSWSSIGERYLNDLLPLPYTEEALNHMMARITEAQDRLGRQILVENPSTYLQYELSMIPEQEFISELAQRSGCGILLDVNNIYVSATNHGFDPQGYLWAIAPQHVQEVHLAGFTVNRFEDGEVLIDSHSRPVAEGVWALYRKALQHLGDRPTLIERDLDIPPLEVLVAEAHKADLLLEEHRALVA